MTSCKGYKVQSCWLPRKNGDLCATCLSEKDKDSVKVLIDSPPSTLEPLITESVERALRSQPQLSYLDQLLHALYKTSRPLLKEYIAHIIKGSLNSTLLLRIRNHTRTSLCSVYAWIIRENLIINLVLPKNCLVCIGHSLKNPYHSESIPRFIHYRHPNFISLLQNTFDMTDGNDRFFQFTCSLIECESIDIRNLLEVLFHLVNVLLSCENKALELKVRSHPFLLDYRGSKHAPARDVIKARIEPWREELTAKVWHPSRFQHWCLNDEEKKELVETLGDPLIGASLTPGLRAEWDIEW